MPEDAGHSKNKVRVGALTDTPAAHARSLKVLKANAERYEEASPALKETVGFTLRRNFNNLVVNAEQESDE
jgi:hypothetical protein